MTVAIKVEFIISEGIGNPIFTIYGLAAGDPIHLNQSEAEDLSDRLAMALSRKGN